MVTTYQIVEGGSAIIGDAYERRDTIHADHINMVKFSDATDDGYRKVLHAIKVLLSENADSAGQSTSIYSAESILAYHEQGNWVQGLMPPSSRHTIMSLASALSTMSKERNCLLDSKITSQTAALPIDE